MPLSDRPLPEWIKEKPPTDEEKFGGVYERSKAVWKQYLKRKDIPAEKFMAEWDKLKKQAGSDKVDWKLPTKEVVTAYENRPK